MFRDDVHSLCEFVQLIKRHSLKFYDEILIVTSRIFHELTSFYFAKPRDVAIAWNLVVVFLFFEVASTMFFAIEMFFFQPPLTWQTISIMKRRQGNCEMWNYSIFKKRTIYALVSVLRWHSKIYHSCNRHGSGFLSTYLTFLRGT